MGIPTAFMAKLGKTPAYHHTPPCKLRFLTEKVSGYVLPFAIVPSLHSRAWDVAGTRPHAPSRSLSWSVRLCPKAVRKGFDEAMRHLSSKSYTQNPPIHQPHGRQKGGFS